MSNPYKARILRERLESEDENIKKYDSLVKGLKKKYQ